jgi:hypothetical protein
VPQLEEQELDSARALLEPLKQLVGGPLLPQLDSKAVETREAEQAQDDSLMPQVQAEVRLA